MKSNNILAIHPTTKVVGFLAIYFVNAEVVNNKVTGLSPGVYIFVINGKYEGRVIVQ